jgi:hypothetical protein
VRNVVEDIVKLMYPELLQSVPGAHDCPICREDVYVYALNRVSPHYVSTLKGEVLSKLEMNKDQGRADMSIAIMQGMRAVAAAPRCGRRPAISP